jgi:hypothetical protein
MRGSSEWGLAPIHPDHSAGVKARRHVRAEEGGIVRGGNLLICLGICRLRMIETTALAGRDPIRDDLTPPSTWRAT